MTAPLPALPRIPVIRAPSSPSRLELREREPWETRSNSRIQFSRGRIGVEKEKKEELALLAGLAPALVALAAAFAAIFLPVQTMVFGETTLKTLEHRPALLPVFIVLAGEMVLEFRDRSVALAAGEDFMVGRPDRAARHVRISLGQAQSRAEVEQGLGILAALLAQMPAEIASPA